MLNPLLAWPKERMGKATRAKLLDWAQKWLTLHIDKDDADFVLGYLLSSLEITSDERDLWPRRALVLAREPERFADETHLLKALLLVANWYPDDVPANDILRLAGNWLDHHPDHRERSFVFSRILPLNWLADDVWMRVARAAINLMTSRSPAHDDDFLLNSVLNRIDMLPADDKSKWLDHTCSWIETCGRPSDVIGLLVNVNKKLAAVREALRARLDVAHRTRFPADPGFDWESPLG